MLYVRRKPDSGDHRIELRVGAHHVAVLVPPVTDVVRPRVPVGDEIAQIIRDNGIERLRLILMGSTHTT